MLQHVDVVAVDAGSIPVGHGPHPAASPYGTRISNALGVTAIEVNQVKLLAGSETVKHGHLDDRKDDVYAIVAGTGWVFVDDGLFSIGTGPVRAGERRVRAAVLSVAS
ncbi:cupin [Rhodococcus sp. G-MC3]|uniref:cupin n=1 Tax=Rhodococcus sp. G-MC3 TaxID=3046209 RepID=UPI0024BA9E88|nr:cupin [Rhodococcus sp. G-MC3]MDJ0396127.1 cupin [Rhodococcus sp. G-MC3]